MDLPLKLVVLIIGAALLVSIVAISYLAVQGTAVPDVLQNIAVGSLTGLIGVLVKTKDNV